MIVDYLGRTYRKLNSDMGNVELYGALAARLEEIRRGEEKNDYFRIVFLIAVSDRGMLLY